MTVTDPAAPPTTSSIEGDILINPKLLAEHPANVRKVNGDLTGLEASIRELGILQPLLVQFVGDGYQVLAGRRRLQAALNVELPEVPIRILSLEKHPVALAVLAE